MSNNDGPWINPEDFRKWSGLLRWSQGAPGNGYSVTAMGYNAKWNSTDQIPLRAVQSGAIDRFGAVDPSDGGETARYSLSFDMARRNDAGLFLANAYAIRSRLNLFSDFTYFLDDPVNGDQFEQAERRQIFGGAVSQSWFGKLGGMDTTNKIGLQVRNDSLDPVALYNTLARERLSIPGRTRSRNPAPACILKTLCTGQKSSAPSPACAMTTIASTWRAIFPKIRAK